MGANDVLHLNIDFSVVGQTPAPAAVLLGVMPQYSVLPHVISEGLLAF